MQTHGTHVLDHPATCVLLMMSNIGDMTLSICARNCNGGGASLVLPCVQHVGNHAMHTILVYGASGFAFQQVLVRLQFE